MSATQCDEHRTEISRRSREIAERKEGLTLAGIARGVFKKKKKK